VYVSGWGGIVNSIDNTQTGTTYNMPITDDAFQKKTDGSDFYLAIFDRDLTKLVYGTYFGGPYTPEHVDGGTSRFDREGKVYQSVCGGCGGLSDFPTTPNAWSTVNRGRRTKEMSFGGTGGCNNAMFKIDLNSSDYPPQFRDTLITVYAGNMVDYNFDITTPDNDSIYVKARSSLFGTKGSANIGFRADSGISKVKAHFYWQTQCNNVSTDTFVVAVTARNNSCPVPRVATHLIKILVKEPPIPSPPAIFCLERLDSHTVRVNWDDFTVGWYFGGYKLVKKYPDGHTTVADLIKTDKDRSYTDVHDTGLYTQDYQYMLYGSNVCNALGDSTRWLHTVPDPDSIPKPVYIYTATVENDRAIRLIWGKYERADFYYYYIYRRINKPGAQYELYTAIKDQNDTTLLDSDVDVHARSYCYKIIVHNQCGLISPDGNTGCSIFLSGTSQPFEHHLSWNPYEKWPVGVCQYQVHRWDPSKPDSLIGFSRGNTPAFIDDSLNYDQGVYWYKVIADECINGHSQHSVSNTIKLIQAPYLYIPNAFTPNNDGLNDRWQLVPVFVKDYHLKIFDGWGGFVWETYDKHATWDGKYKGGKTFNNVFIWQTEYSGWDNSRHYEKGNVTILP
jgi:gliding motility-associated-like protein